MKKKEWNEGLNHLDPDIIEKYVEQKDRLRQKNKKAKGTWFRFGVIAACLMMIVSAVIVVHMLQEDEPGGIITDDSVVSSSNNNVPSISTIKSGSKITGKQEIVYGDTSSGSEGDASMIAPGFYINTVVHANVIEVLPDRYYEPGSTYQYHVARLSVVEAIRGDGLPDEIFLKFPYYSSDIFDGYDTFIFSLQQVGVENYMMINDTKHEVAYFSHMFIVEMVNDLGYGSVIAFNDDKVDPSFFDKANHFNVSLENTLQNPSLYFYPVGYDTTMAEAKANIKELSEKSDNESIYVRNRPYDYITADNIFVSNEGKQIKNYLEPSETSVFMQEIYIREDRIVATYTRVVNGFITEEKVTVNGYTGENGNVSISDVKYSEEDLAKVPNIGEALANMKLSELKPTHIEIVDGMHFKYSTAMGVYRKVEDKIYGIIRVMWYYTYPERTNGYVKDDCYYLYDQEGNGSIVERSELREHIGDDWFIARFSYNEYIEFDK